MNVGFPGQYQQPMHYYGMQLTPIVNPKLFDGRAMFFQAPVDNSQIPKPVHLHLHGARLLTRTTRRDFHNGYELGTLQPYHLTESIFSDYPTPRLPTLPDHICIFFTYTQYHAGGSALFLRYDCTSQHGNKYDGHHTTSDYVEYLVEIRIHKDAKVHHLGDLIKKETSQLEPKTSDCCGCSPMQYFCCLGYRGTEEGTILNVGGGVGQGPHEFELEVSNECDEGQMTLSRAGITHGARLKASDKHVKTCCGGRTGVNWTFAAVLFWVFLGLGLPMLNYMWQM